MMSHVPGIVLSVQPCLVLYGLYVSSAMLHMYQLHLMFYSQLGWSMLWLPAVICHCHSLSNGYLYRTFSNFHSCGTVLRFTGHDSVCFSLSIILPGLEFCFVPLENFKSIKTIKAPSSRPGQWRSLSLQPCCVIIKHIDRVRPVASFLKA